MRRIKKKKACHFAKPYPPYQIKTIIIPIEIVKLEDESFHMIVRAEIDGIKGDMIIDTGASVTVIDKAAFPDKNSDENRGKIQSGSVSGQINDVHLIKTAYIKIGKYKIKNPQLASIDMNYVNDMYNQHLKRKVIGLLGCDFCVRYGVTIDFRNIEISIHH